MRYFARRDDPCTERWPRRESLNLFTNPSDASTTIQSPRQTNWQIVSDCCCCAATTTTLPGAPANTNNNNTTQARGFICSPPRVECIKMFHFAVGVLTRHLSIRTLRRRPRRYNALSFYIRCKLASDSAYKRHMIYNCI